MVETYPKTAGLMWLELGDAKVTESHASAAVLGLQPHIDKKIDNKHNLFVKEMSRKNNLV